MKKRIIAASLISASLLSACSLGGSSETVIGEFNFSPKILNPDPTGFEVLENQVSAFTVSATDPDLDPLTLTISGTDSDLFVHSGGGVIEFQTAPDFEMPSDANADNRYDMTITVSDGVNSDVVDFAVTVLNDTSDDPITFAECAAYTNNQGNAVANYQECTVTKDDSGRTFIIYVPPAYENRTGSVPLLFSLHGYTSRANWNLLYTGFQEYADQEGFIIAYPQGTILESTGETHWNVGGWTTDSTADDVGFLGVVADYLGAAFEIDTERVYSTGMSNGGFMSYKLACDDSGRFAAVSSVTGSMTPETFADCNPTRAVPVMQIHGKMDPTVPYAGSAISEPIDDVVDYWANANDCTTPGTATLIPDSAADSDILGGTHTVFSGCESGTSVEYYLLDALEHRWPNRNRFDIHAAEKLWNFMSSYDLNGSIQ